jgi:hypothetical protein
MSDASAYDRPFWDIDTLIAAMGKDAAAALCEIECAAGLDRLRITGLYRFEEPRKQIPTLEFADKVIWREPDGTSYLGRAPGWIELATWLVDLRVQAEDAQVFLRERGASTEPVIAPKAADG